MPYITDTEKQTIDPAIDALFRYAFGADPEVAVVKKGNGIFFWYLFLHTLHSALQRRIMREHPADGMHYHDHNALQGVFSCALEELFYRWKEAYVKFGFVPLEMHAPVLEHVGAYETGVVSCFKREVRSAIATHVDELVLTFSDEFTGVKVGEINYAISEVANALGNTERAPHQEMLDVFVSTNHALYRDSVFPYEKEAVTKNGDTRGFIEFWRVTQERFATR
ncbi:MAG: hypothetical protein A3C93_01200 [Candidatus Lloydbacteria bacterium RIFCSPHIGHO2_02_FULL_54_17]|uniref:Uncharacterized protein n=1 Tax=Candidatus Lloydbacteria bacterium RIFCSPHIGHO2_02_FULL_54_17 TaxID=1798664 RepID=A0A1G2DDA2_9BACT|nr:MAG: hypothetical protein A3C93_01200 [Candidatus Lloydbacteria bacterium RIFCSPHIGHO2_02_FULL_54_17]OGZ14412.1 MAG: hypothetical protein A2948_00555 [Candidatus Lloydbacteria bacterium RIFCSPLOWO2_01_FULL_54_18]OGZ16795.1 MAG: hypothetical protein A3H76_02035 [Candidatus Lloydbacteria bacterium RIFCSPLOWO2_02_FULL_54_12]